MIHPECGVPGCRRTVADGAPICSHCGATLAEQLQSVPDLLDDLLVTISRQDRIGAGGVAGPPDEQPAPRLDVTRALDALVGEITTWARDLSETHGLTIPVPGRPAQDARLHSAARAADWLAEHVHLIRVHPAALEAHRALTAAIGTATARTDRRPPQVYRGPCECGAELHAEPGAVIVTCRNRACRRTYDGRQLRESLLAQAADQLLTTAELSAALTGLSEATVKVGTIHSWHHRGQLRPSRWLHDGHLVLLDPHLRPAGPGTQNRPRPERCCRPLYRVGDAAKLLDALRSS